MKAIIRSSAKMIAILSAAVLMLCWICDCFTPSRLTVNTQNSKLLSTSPALSIRCGNTAAGNTAKTQRAELFLFGAVPVKEVNISFDGHKNVIPGGEPFGIRIYTNGLVVSDMTEIPTQDGTKNPASKAGIQCGDIILSVNGQMLKTNEQLLQCVEKSGGKAIELKIRHRSNDDTVFVTPVKDIQQNKYRIGLWVRDSCAGIGTMTFIDPQNNCFSGLGHGICDSESGSLMPLEHGDIVDASVSSIRKSTCGMPGSLSGYFTDSQPIGELCSNCDYGVYGTLAGNISGKTVPVAYCQEVKKGKAQIISTIHGTKPEYYDIEIEDVNCSDLNSTKNMIIKITDQSLLEQTGGIVQGMSGSPIIQNDMLVGAVTHVFVNDPTRGYALFAETMLTHSSNVVQNGTLTAS